MSWKLVKWALSTPTRGLDRLVLVELANFAKKETARAWPSLTTLASRAGIGKSTLCRVLDRLEGAGFIVREHNGTRSTVYRLVPERDTNALVSPSGTELVPERDRTSPRAGHESPIEPPIEPRERSSTPRDLTERDRATGVEISLSSHDYKRH